MQGERDLASPHGAPLADHDGQIERFHQSLRKEFLADRTFATLNAAQEALDGWVAVYTTSDLTKP
jgi:hypothetical protein